MPYKFQEREPFNILDIAKILKMRKSTQGRTALFLGARAGGLFRSPLLHDTLKEMGPKNLYSMPPLERFQECFNILCSCGEQDIYAILKKVIKDMYFEIADICAAELMKQEIFDPVITTNIDNTLEDAFKHIGMKGLHEFNVFIPKEAKKDEYVFFDKTYPFTLVKFYGDFSSREYNVNRRSAHFEKHEDLKRVMDNLRDQNMLMVGFDPVWDSALIPALFPRTNTLWYVNEQQPVEDKNLSLYLENCQAECIWGVDGNYENFFRSLHWHVIGAMPTYQLTLEILAELGIVKEQVQALREEIRQLSTILSSRKHVRPGVIRKTKE